MKCEFRRIIMNALNLKPLHATLFQNLRTYHVQQMYRHGMYMHVSACLWTNDPANGRLSYPDKHTDAVSTVH